MSDEATYRAVPLFSEGQLKKMASSPVPIEEMISEQNVFSKCWFCWFTLSEKLPPHRKSPKSFLCNRLMFRLTQKILPLNFS